MADTHYILFYDYVDDILEKRAPHRDAHLNEIRAGTEDGRILMAGPLGDPPHGAAIVFKDETVAKDFAQADPYVTNGLVTDWRVDLWSVVS